MKRTISIIAILLGLVLFLSNFTVHEATRFVLTVVNDEPVLPSEPFKYAVENIPTHLSPDPNSPEPDTTFVGYGSGGPIDSTVLTDINNDVATLGRVLFYDEKLSALENISCATCHDQSLSFTENKAFSEGISSLTLRNSMHLNDLGWSNKDGFSWDMESPNLIDMIRLPLTDENEIGADMDDIALKLEATTYYSDLFELSYGDSEITEERIIEALAQFINSMVTFNSRFDQQVEKEFADFTDEELLGLEVFSFACGECHVQGNHFGLDGTFEESALFIFPFFFNNALPHDPDDNGAGDWAGMDDLFKIPTLRNIELTAPYMHDGRFATLEAVVNHYSEDAVINEWDIGIIPDGGFKFSEEEKEGLVAFLKTLTDETFITNPKWSDPFGKPLGTANTLHFENLVMKPNPMSDRAVIEFGNPESKMVSINVISNDGRLIKHDNTFSNQYILEKENFIPGLYYIELIMDDVKSTQKLIVQ